MRLLVTVLSFALLLMGVALPTSIAQTDRPFCNLSSDVSLRVYAQPRSDSLVVSEVSPTSIYPVLARVENEFGDWYQIELPTRQMGWVLDMGVNVAGEGCADVPVIARDEASTDAPPSTTVEVEATLAPNQCPPDFNGYLPTRIQIGMGDVRVQTGVFAVVRAEPSANSDIIARLEPATVVEILAGPLCTNGVVWWQIATDSIEGWTAESSQPTNTYFLVPPVVELWVDETSPLLTEDNIGNIQRNAVVSTAAPIRALALSPRQLAALDEEGALYLWSYPSGQPRDDLSAILQTVAVQSPITTLAYDRYGDFLLLGREDGRFVIFETTQAIVNIIDTAHTTPLLSLAFDRTNSRLLVTSADGVSLWDLTTYDAVNSTLATLWHITPPQGRAVQLGVLAADGTPLILTEGGLVVLNAENGETMSDFVTVTDAVLLPAPLDIGDGRIVWVSDGGVLRTYALDDGGLVDEAEMLAFSGVRAMALHPSETLVALTDGAQVMTYALPTWDALSQLPAGAVTDLRFSPDGRAVITFAADEISVWSVRVGRAQ